MWTMTDKRDIDFHMPERIRLNLPELSKPFLMQVSQRLFSFPLSVCLAARTPSYTKC
jgi:hypothetical protein